MIRFSKFIGYKCVYCGKYSGKSLNNLYNDDMSEYQIIQAVKKLYCSCKLCGKNFKFKKDNQPIGVFHKWFDNEHELTLYIRGMNGENREVTIKDFVSGGKR